MQAVAIMCNAKKRVSAKQLQRDLEVSYNRVVLGAPHPRSDDYRQLDR